MRSGCAILMYACVGLMQGRLPPVIATPCQWIFLSRCPVACQWWALSTSIDARCDEMTRANEYERALTRPDLDVGEEGCQLPVANHLTACPCRSCVCLTYRIFLACLGTTQKTGDCTLSFILFGRKNAFFITDAHNLSLADMRR